MRITLTLDDDVAALLKREIAQRRSSLGTVVNEALRESLRSLATPKMPPATYRTGAVALGRCLLGDVDDVADVLAVAESDASR